jgi:hypothetical protein
MAPLFAASFSPWRICELLDLRNNHSSKQSETLGKNPPCTALVANSHPDLVAPQSSQQSADTPRQWSMERDGE